MVITPINILEENKTKQNKTKQNKTKQNETKRNETKRNGTERNETKRNERNETEQKNEQNGTEQNRTEQNRTEQNRTEQNRTEQNRTEQNRTEQNRTEQNKPIKIKKKPIPAVLQGGVDQLLAANDFELRLEWPRCEEIVDLLHDARMLHVTSAHLFLSWPQVLWFVVLLFERSAGLDATLTLLAHQELARPATRKGSLEGASRAGEGERVRAGRMGTRMAVRTARMTANTILLSARLIA